MSDPQHKHGLTWYTCIEPFTMALIWFGLCVCVFFCDCQSQYENGFCIENYDEKVSAKWAAFLLAVSNFWLHTSSIVNMDHWTHWSLLFSTPQFLTASKPSEFPPTLILTIEQTTDDGRLFTGPNAQNWPAAQDVTKTGMSVARVHQVHVHKISCSISS